MDAADPAPEFARWEELPPSVLAALVERVPYKRADVRLVCTTWREAINSSLLQVKLPAQHVRLLRQLPAVRRLEVTSPDVDPPLSLEGWTGPWMGAVRAATSERLTSLTFGRCSNAMEAFARSLRASQQRLLATAAAAAAGGQPPCASSADGAGSGSSSEDSTWLPRGLQELQELLFVEEFFNLDCVDTGFGNTAGVRDWGDTLSGLLHTLPADAGGGVAGTRLVPLPHLHTVKISAQTMPGDCTALAQLPALHTLHLDGHFGVCAAPPDVSGCTGLTELRLQHGYMFSLPQHLFKLSRLQDLTITSCASLTSLEGAGVGGLTSLTSLCISNCDGLWKDCSSLPADYVQRVARQDAAIRGGGASVVAEALVPDVMSLPALPHQQQLQLFPELASLTALRRLAFPDNRDMRMLPASLSSLTQLEHLDASDCSLAYFDDHLLACTALTALLLSNNVLTDLPEGISRLQQLQVLDVGRCEALWRLPRELLSLSKLTHLVITEMALDQHVVEQLQMRPVPVEVECTYEHDDEEEFEDEDEDEVDSVD